MTDQTLEVTFDLSMLHPAQRQIARDPHRFRVGACGRRFGKTTEAAAESVLEALRSGRVWYVAPTYSLAGVAWREMRGMVRGIPNASVRNTDRVIELPGGGEITVKSAEDVDRSLRGEGLDFLVLEEFAFMRPEAWDVLRPALADRLGRALFISTPLGHNHFFELWQRGQDTAHNPDWKSFHFPTSSNPRISAAELAEIKRTTPQIIWEREYLAEFNDAAGAVFRNVRESLYRGREVHHANHRYVMGCDLAMQTDYSVIVVIDQDTGRVVDIDRFNQVSWAIQRQRIQAMCWKWKVATAYIEANSIGSPNIEALQAVGLPVKGFWTTNESKQEAVQGLALAFEQGEIGLPFNHPLIEPMLQELAAFQATQLDSGRWKYGAAGSAHDDCVMALAIAWHTSRRRKPIVATLQRYS